MKHFYIPTSSLNFNNIFSSESISPAAFYEKRGFGYRRWTNIPENNLANAILLYDSPHMFSRPDCGLEDHPMLVEIRSDEEFVTVTEGVYCTNQTIYLNPWNTRIWFFSNADLVTALSLSDSSLETKLLRLYKKNIQVGTFEGTYNLIEIKDLELNVVAIESDKRINRMKGLLYGYYIGACKSVTPQIAESLHSLNNIHDTFAAIALNPDKKATPLQVDALVQAFDVLVKNNPFYEDLIRVSQSNEVASAILKLLAAYDVHTPLYDYDVVRHLEILHSSQGEANYSLSWVKNQITAVESDANAAKKLLQPDAAEIIVYNCELSTLKSIQDETLKNLFFKWVNGLFLEERYNGKISAQRVELATDLTRAARDFLVSNWESSSIRAFLNQLRHLANGEDAQLDWSLDVLAQVAAVVYKGDDWNQLLRFMQTKNMFDYRIAFAIYGELNGFANLTRDFTDILLNQDNKYVAEVYKEFYGQLLGRDICVDSMPKAILCQALEAIVEPSASQVENKPNSQLREKVLDYFNSDEFDYNRKEKVRPELMVALEENGDNEDPNKFLQILHKQEGWGKMSKPGKLMAEKFKEKKGKSIFPMERDLFSGSEENTSENLATNTIDTDNKATLSRPIFIVDPEAFLIIEPSLPEDKKVRDQVRTDLTWFQDNYKETYIDEKGNKQHGRYYRNKADNTSTIIHFHDYCNKRTEAASWTSESWEKVDIDSIIAKLKDVYQ